MSKCSECVSRIMCDHIFMLEILEMQREHFIKLRAPQEIFAPTRQAIKYHRRELLLRMLHEPHILKFSFNGADLIKCDKIT